MAEPFRCLHRVIYAECTVGNHVYHSRYFDFLEFARGEFIRSLGTTVKAWQEGDAIFPVIEARARYRAPARYDDLLTLEVCPTRMDRVRIHFGHRIFTESGRLVLEAETFHACTTCGEKPRRLPPEMAQAFQNFVNPDYLSWNKGG